MELKPQQGIIGFFDILGYTSFLENNSPEDAANLIAETLLKIPEEVRRDAECYLGEDSKYLLAVQEEVKWLIFSDTILIALPYEGDAPPIERFPVWTSFVITSILLYRTMFDYGLPLRGAITNGFFVVQDTCFAGRTIIEAYRLAHSLDLSAVVLSRSAGEDLVAAYNESGYGFHHFCFEYLIPLKAGGSSRLFGLSPTPCRMPLEGELRQLISESFWQHKKDVAPEVMTKINNTEMFFRFVKMEHPEAFE